MSARRQDNKVPAGSAAAGTLLRRAWRGAYAVPPEHGAWVWWIGPLCMGAAAAGQVTATFPILTVAALAGFMAKQPLAVGVSVLTGRRDGEDLAPALFWGVVYATAGGIAALALWYTGHGRAVLLPLLGIPVFAWYVLALTRGVARHNTPLDAAGAAVLALAAPAAYWTCGGQDPSLPWLVWTVAASQSVASVVHVVSQLQFSRLDRAPEGHVLRRIRGPALACHTATLALGLGFAMTGVTSWYLAAAFLLTWIDGVHGAFRPPYGARPMRIGVRQLAVSVAFVAIACIGFAVAHSNP
ncbi:MAG: YwiC-like family protein [bacterium]|nr:YwiC-like family protein [bacterium]